MAGNVVKNRRWIAQTYAANPVSAAAQAWVDAHPEARTQQAIADGLLKVFKTFSPRDLGRLSHHLSGLAFDVRPVPAQASAFWNTVLSLPGLRQHFDTEGGLTIWHVGFDNGRTSGPVSTSTELQGNDPARWRSARLV